MAVRARGGEGVEGWWSFRRRVEAGGEKSVLGELEKSGELEDLTRKNVVKALAFRGAAFEGFARPAPSTTTTAEGAEPIDAELQAEQEATDLHPSTLFLNRSYHHYLRHLALLTLSTEPTPDPTRVVHQLTQRLTPSDTRGAPRPVLTIPVTGRRMKAGERTEGWEGVQGSKRGGPISLAKAGRSRSERRKEQWTGSKRSEEQLAGESA